MNTFETQSPNLPLSPAGCVASCQWVNAGSSDSQPSGSERRDAALTHKDETNSCHDVVIIDFIHEHQQEVRGSNKQEVCWEELLSAFLYRRIPLFRVHASRICSADVEFYVPFFLSNLKTFHHP